LQKDISESENTLNMCKDLVFAGKTNFFRVYYFLVNINRSKGNKIRHFVPYLLDLFSMKRISCYNDRSF
jgi:hypothetical protein